MRALAELKSHVAQALSAVAFDIDDTVTEGGVLDDAAYSAMFRLRDAGFIVLAATGRPLGFAEVFARTWPVHAAIGENGAGYVFRAGKHCQRVYWDDDATRAVQRVILDRIEARVRLELPHIFLASDAWARRCDLAFDIGEEANVPAHDVAQLCALIADEGASATVSSVHAHAQLGRHDKATGIAWVLAQEHGMSAEDARARCLFVGDSGNDAPAFAWFTHNAAVANVHAHLHRLPVAPAFVASRAHGAGFREIVDTLLRLRGAS